MTDNAPPKCPDEIIGTKLKVVHCEGAWDSFQIALQSIRVAKHSSVKATLDMLVKKLANGGPLSKETFPPEGLLPCAPGKKAKKFYAFKKNTNKSLWLVLRAATFGLLYKSLCLQKLGQTVSIRYSNCPRKLDKN